MKNDREGQPGLGSGRTWGAIVGDGAVVEWSIDSQSGLVQGPLDLGFLRGRRLLVQLEPEQMALLICDNDLRAVYLDGGHILEIGNSDRQIPPTAGLIFLAADRELHLRWTKLDPVIDANLPAGGAIGRCSLAIESPARFYSTFLANTTAWDEQSITAAIDRVARGALLDLLGDGARIDEAELQARLTDLPPEELSELLADAGLVCRRLAVYTAAPPAEIDADQRAGQFGELIHN